jgi:S-adenosylmethionine hydrolase
MQPIITLITDYGLDDHFAGVVKGVILGINPEVRIVDICHSIKSYDALDGAYTLAQSYRYFPPGTIHLVVVDPGVGGPRRPILASSAGYSFVAPDNGVLSTIYDADAAVEVREIQTAEYFLNPVSNTFHGRDIFAPVAARLSRGADPSQFGPQITDYIRIPIPKVRRVGDDAVAGTVIKVDKFGNLITNISPEDVPELFSEKPSPFAITINSRRITHQYRSFSDAKSTEPFALLGSSGLLEIGINQASAAKILKAQPGTEVIMVLGEARRSERF